MPTRRQMANALRMLSVDAIQKANSGHPGAPMGMADIAEVLWNSYLKHNPLDPNWSNRDRFVLSNGHASMLLYSLLHMTGYDLSLEEIKNFRQLDSKTPGHPEYGVTPGVETTTGPLGQGLSNAVGMALAEKILAERFNQPEYPIVDHFTYVFVGDGCLMEGISHEACSLAGTLGLNKLIVIYDDNGITIDGKTQNWYTENTPKRFESYGWNVIPAIDGHDSQQIDQALQKARQEKSRPTLICCQTQIAFGSTNLAGSHKAHGAPLGQEEVEEVRKNLDWSYPAFEIPQEIYDAWDAREQGEKVQRQWQELFNEYAKKYPDLASEYTRCLAGKLPQNFDQKINDYIVQVAEQRKDTATRKASNLALEGLGPILPELFGGSADLSGSNKTYWSGSKAIAKLECLGNYCHFGVRELAMTGMMNGVALHGGFIPYCGTFLVFSDYSRSSIRLACLMGIRNILVLSHDSIGVGEDGPTHQPIEHASSLRLIPNMQVWRPCDAVETIVAWKCAVQNMDGPTALLLSRQGLSHQERDAQTLANIERGGYILEKEQENLQGIIIASGSEVDLAIKAARQMKDRGYNIRVVSMPCTSTFDSQDSAYQESVLPQEIKARVVVEAGVSPFWYKYVGEKGKVIGIDSFGHSAPGKELFEHFQFTENRIIKTMQEVLKKNG